MTAQPVVPPEFNPKYVHHNIFTLLGVLPYPPLDCPIQAVRLQIGEDIKDVAAILNPSTEAEQEMAMGIALFLAFIHLEWSFHFQVPMDPQENFSDRRMLLFTPAMRELARNFFAELWGVQHQDHELTSWIAEHLRDDNQLIIEITKVRAAA